MDEDGFGCTAGDDVAGFLWLESRVHRDQYTAGGEQPEGRDDPVRRVRCPQGDAVTFLDAKVREGTCGATDPIDNIAKGVAERTVDDCFCVAEAVRRAQDHLGDGLPQLRVCHTVTRRDRFPPMIFAWSSTDRCDSALT